LHEESLYTCNIYIFNIVPMVASEWCESICNQLSWESLLKHSTWSVQTELWLLLYTHAAILYTTCQANARAIRPNHVIHSHGPCVSVEQVCTGPVVYYPFQLSSLAVLQDIFTFIWGWFKWCSFIFYWFLNIIWIQQIAAAASFSHDSLQFLAKRCNDWTTITDSLQYSGITDSSFFL